MPTVCKAQETRGKGGGVPACCSGGHNTSETDNHGVSGDRWKRKPVVGKGEELPGTGRPGTVSGRGGAGGRRGASSSRDLSDVRERTRWFLRERMFQAEGRAHAKPRGGAMSARPWGVACGRAGGPWRLQGVLAPSFTFHGKGDSFATGHLRHRGTPLQKYRFLGSSVEMHGSRPPGSLSAVEVTCSLPFPWPLCSAC